MPVEDVNEMTDEEVDRETMAGCRALNIVLSALSQRKRLELIASMYDKAVDAVNHDPNAIVRYHRICLEAGCLYVRKTV